MTFIPTGRIAECFFSIQGEGVTVGMPAVFIRLQGCSVGCSWCDTKYSWDPAGGHQVTLEALIEDVRAFPCRRAVVTGGEPLESSLFTPLVEALNACGFTLEVETSGVLPPPPVHVDQWNVSLKLANSGVPEARRINREAIRDFSRPGSLVEVRGGRPRRRRRGVAAHGGVRFTPRPDSPHARGDPAGRISRA